MCHLHGSTSRGTVPPARAKASAHPAQEPPLGEQEGEEGHQPRTVGEELETAGHDQMTLFVTRKRLHMQYLPDPLDEWIARDIQLSPGNDYVDHTAGETLSIEEREECERYLERFHQRYKLGGKADRLVRIVDRHMPRIAEETESSSCSFRTRWKRCCEGPAGSAERFGQGEGSNKGKQPHRQRTSHQRLDAEQYNDGSFVEDTPPDWGTWQRLRKATSKAANPWPWGPEGRPSDTGRSQEVLAERPAEPARAPQPTGETPAAQRGHPVTLLPNQRWHEVRQVQAHMAQFSRHRAWQTRGPQ